MHVSMRDLDDSPVVSFTQVVEGASNFALDDRVIQGIPPYLGGSCSEPSQNRALSLTPTARFRQIRYVHPCTIEARCELNGPSSQSRALSRVSPPKLLDLRARGHRVVLISHRGGRKADPAGHVTPSIMEMRPCILIPPLALIDLRSSAHSCGREKSSAGLCRWGSH